MSEDKKRILIVDDSADDIQFLMENLEGFSVLVATSGKKGLEIIKAEPEACGIYKALTKLIEQAIAKATKKPIKEVLAAIEVITGLNPYPGEKYTDRDVHYIIPDVYVHKVEDEYLIILNDEGLPRLKVSSAYEEVVDGKVSAVVGFGFI